MKSGNKIDKYLENVKGGLVFGFSALLVMIGGGMIYATLSFPDLETVSQGDTLKAESWNEMVEAINSLKAESNANFNTLNALNTNLNTLSGTVANISNSVPAAPNIDGQIYSGGKYYKYLGNYSWDNAVKECSKLGDGWKLTSIQDLIYIYNNKSSFSGWSITDYYCSDEIYSNPSETINGIRFNLAPGGTTPYFQHMTYISEVATCRVICVNG